MHVGVVKFPSSSVFLQDKRNHTQKIKNLASVLDTDVIELDH